MPAPIDILCTRHGRRGSHRPNLTHPAFMARLPHRIGLTQGSIAMRAMRARPRSGRFVNGNLPLGKDRPRSPLRTPRWQPRCAGAQLERPNQRRPPWEAASTGCVSGDSAPAEVPNHLPSARTPAWPACPTTVDPSPRRWPVASRCASANPPSRWPSTACAGAATKLGWASTPSPPLSAGTGPKAKNRAEASPQR